MSQFSGITTTVLQAWLAQALQAQHLLMTGQRSVYVSFGERRVQYTQATAKELQSYISSIQTEISIRQGTSPDKPYAVAVWTR